MRKVLALSIGILFYGNAAFGQAGVIALVHDPGYMPRCYWDVAMGLVSVYAVHRFTPGVTASRWMLVNGGGFNCVYIEESSPMPTVAGSAYTGISISYGECLSSDVLLIKVDYFCLGISPPCAYINVVPDPAAPTGMIEVVDCDSVKRVGVGLKLWINNNGTCNGLCWWPTKDTSWGQVKALYR